MYGPRQDPHGEAGVVAIFATRLVHGEPVVINGDGTQTRDYVHVHDVVRANLAAVDGPAGVYNIGTGVETDVNTLYRMLAAAAGCQRRRRARSGQTRRAATLVPRHQPIARERLGWSAAIGFDEGVQTHASTTSGPRASRRAAPGRARGSPTRDCAAPCPHHAARRPRA